LYQQVRVSYFHISDLVVGMESLPQHGAEATRQPLDHPIIADSCPLPRDVEDVELVHLADADSLARGVDFPAVESGPLFRLMFPRPSAGFSEQQRDEIIRWHIQGIKEAILSGKTHLRKVCNADGIPVGLAGWVIERDPKEQDTNVGKSAAAGMEERGHKQRIRHWVPEALDMSAWSNVSADLKAERNRVMENLDNVCRTSSFPGNLLEVRIKLTGCIGLTIMSVRPDCQHQGLGSLLMQHICQDIDRHSWYGYVLASPAGVNLYSKFGFEVVGQVDTPQGTIISMLRQPGGRKICPRYESLSMQ
jgi:GNAT superfamily N-acetyltransferase